MKKTGGDAMTIQLMMVISFMLCGVVVVGQEVVLDIDNNPVKANTSYTIMDSFGRFISLFKLQGLCPLAVVASPFLSPASFKFVSSSDVITVTTKFNIKSVTPDLCGGSRLWSAVLNNPVFMNGSVSSIESTFSFKKSQTGGYKIVSGSTDIQGNIDLGNYLPLIPAFVMKAWASYSDPLAMLGANFHLKVHP